MEVDENLRKKFDDDYFRLIHLDGRLYGYPGGAFIPMSIIFGVIFLPLSVLVYKYPLSMLVNKYSICIPVLFWFLLLFFIYKVNKYLPQKDQLLKNIRKQEKELLDIFGLNYCGCGIGSHFFSPSSKQLYNIKSDILFDHHSNEKYLKWHSQWDFDPKWVLSNYYRFSIFIVLFNLLVSFYVIYSSFQSVT